ncbi:MAG TPA: ADP-ribosylglycohydrolase family protein [Candidatus Acidoferrum sp.]|nr:ADP-ribosylglycohydrolase family protein [Candidatus Acidoferrum sp.]
MEPKTTKALPSDHNVRMGRALLSLEGLSVGDGFGQWFLTDTRSFVKRIQHREPPPAPWIVTDDTAMAVSIVRILKRCGRIDQDALASGFAEEYVREPGRGYGRMAHIILHSIHQGLSWREAARRAFDGQGSCGNGGAMRSAPIGAYFADDYDRVIYEAKLSAEITHAHPDGQTGAAAVALAAAWMVAEHKAGTKGSFEPIEFVLNRLPQTETYYRVKEALNVPFDQSPLAAAEVLGNGIRVIASDTVPFCLWCAARHADSFIDALWATVSAFGDLDTTCAIVGGIVAGRSGPQRIPEQWLRAREPIQI